MIERSLATEDVPLCVDLDGTLVRTDVLDEALLRILKVRPLDLARAFAALRLGRAAFKARIAAIAQIDPSYLPYDPEVLELVRGARAEGRRVVLVTAADATWANAIAQHLGCFDEVLASDGVKNVSGQRKRDALCARFGQRGFDYAGNAWTDLHVWRRARHAIVVNASPALVRAAQRAASVDVVSPPPRGRIGLWLREIRVHQWSKNVLVFVPLIVSHQLFAPQLFLRTLLTFFALSLCASSVYVVNDLLDLESDRAHRTKRARPFAAGLLGVRSGLIAAPLLLAAGFAIAAVDGVADEAYLAAYVVLTLAYSLYLKRKVLVDIVVLAALYTMRLMLGGAALGVPLSHWLLAFSLFVFFSLAALKRFSELDGLRQEQREAANGRGWLVGDIAALSHFGSSSGFMAVVVFALYINSYAVHGLYHRPDLLWLMCPPLMYWLTRAWLFAQRGWMNEDPIVFALRDRASWLVLSACVAVGLAAL